MLFTEVKYKVSLEETSIYRQKYILFLQVFLKFVLVALHELQLLYVWTFSRKLVLLYIRLGCLSAICGS